MNLLSPSTHLLLVILMPLVGAGIVWLVSSRGLQAVRQSAATTAVLTLIAAGWLILRYLTSTEATSNQVFAVLSVPWLTGGMFDIRLSIGLDGLSLWLFGLSALLSVTAVFVSGCALRPAVSASISNVTLPVWVAFHNTMVIRPRNARTLPARV